MISELTHETLMAPDELGVMLSVNTGTLANWRYKGVGPKFIKVNGKVFYTKDEVRKWLNKNTIQKTRAR